MSSERRWSWKVVRWGASKNGGETWRFEFYEDGETKVMSRLYPTAREAREALRAFATAFRIACERRGRH